MKTTPICSFNRRFFCLLGTCILGLNSFILTKVTRAAELIQRAESALPAAQTPATSPPARPGQDRRAKR